MHISTLPHFPTSTFPNFHISQLPHFPTSTFPNFHTSQLFHTLTQFSRFGDFMLSVSERIREEHAHSGNWHIVYEVQYYDSTFTFTLLLEDHASVLRRRRRVLSMPTKLHGAKTCRFTKRNRVRRMSGVCFLPSSWTESLDRSWRTECLFKNPVALQSARRKYRII